MHLSTGPRKSPTRNRQPSCNPRPTMYYAAMRPINPKHTLLNGKNDNERRFLNGEFMEVNISAPRLSELPPF
jgi:hypothetical protein